MSSIGRTTSTTSSDHGSPSSATASDSAPPPSTLPTMPAAASRRRLSRTPQDRKFSMPDAANTVRRGSQGSIAPRAVTDENIAMDMDAASAHPRLNYSRRTPLADDNANAPGSDSSSSQDSKSRRSPAYDHSEARRTSLPALRLSGAFGGGPSFLPGVASGERDVYDNLRTFRFGDATATTATPGSAPTTDEEMDTMSPLRGDAGAEHDGDDDGDDDEEDEDERRRTLDRAKIRAIDDGSRRPSLPTNLAHRASLASTSITPAVVKAMREDLQHSLERRGSAQAILVPRRASRVSQDQLSFELGIGHRQRSSDPHSEPGSYNKSIRIVDHPQHAMQYPHTGYQHPHHSVEFDINYILNGSMHSLSAPPSPTSLDLAQGDTFLSHIQRYDDEYGKRRSDWLLARQFSVLSDSGRPDPREIWSCPVVGKYCVIRGIADAPGQNSEPSKLRENQILLKQFIDTPQHARRKRAHGPAMLIHNHSRKNVISIFREQNPFKTQEGATPAASILPTPRDLRSFHTRSRPKVQYQDESRLRTGVPGTPRTASEEPPSVPGSSNSAGSGNGNARQDHVYPPTYRALASPTPSTPTSRQATVRLADDGHHRRGHADAFSTADRMHTTSISSIVSIEPPPSATPSRQERGGSLSALFKRKGKHEKPYQPMWVTLLPSVNPTQEEMENMMFSSLPVGASSEGTSTSTSTLITQHRSNGSDSTLRPDPSSSPHQSPEDKETEDEKQRRRVRNLNQSFESVGLIAAKKAKNSPSNTPQVPRDRTPRSTSPTFLDSLPPDSTCFLLPLWPSDAISRKHDRSGPTYHARMDERRYLVVYLVQQSQLANNPSPVRTHGAHPPIVNKKRTRQGQTLSPPTATPSGSSSQAPGGGSTKHGFTPFHVCAKLLTSDDLMQAGMRSLDKGLLIPGNISDALLTVPETSGGPDALGPIIIALCNERQALELVPEGLDKIGLRVQDDTEEDAIDDDPMGISTWANPRSTPAPPERSLTSIGRAVVEIIWAACVAVSAHSAPGSNHLG